MLNRDRPNLLAILEAVERIQGYTRNIATADQYYDTPDVLDATFMNSVVIGEMVDRLSIELKTLYSEVDWQKIKDFRNLVAHDYLGIDAEEVWQIIQDHLPRLQADVDRIAASLPENP